MGMVPERTCNDPCVFTGDSMLISAHTGGHIKHSGDQIHILQTIDRGSDTADPEFCCDANLYLEPIVRGTQWGILEEKTIFK